MIRIKREHSLTREQAREKLEEVAQTLTEEFKLRHAWQGDVLRFKRSGAEGLIAVADDSIDIKIKLGLALAPIKGKIEKAIIESLDEAGVHA